MCRVFYKDQEIENIKHRQEEDTFLQIKEMRSELQLDQHVYGDNTKINILHFAPKKEVKEEKSKKKRGAKLKKGSSKFIQDGDEINYEQLDRSNAHSRHSSLAKSDTSMLKVIEANTLENEIAEMIGEKIFKEELGADA